MIMPRLSKYYWLSLAILGVLLSNCGVESDPHYNKKDKKYGINDANVQSNEGEASINLDGEDVESLRQDPNELIFRSRYQGTMDRQSLKFLHLQPVTGSGVREISPEDSLFYNDFEIPGVGVVRSGDGPAIERLAATPIDLVAEQTAGDKRAATFLQHVNAPFGNSESNLDVFGENSENGTQIYDRVLGSKHCPESLVCINRAQIIPAQGVGQTFCYYNTNGVNTAIPIGLSPGASYEGVKNIPHKYGPFIVRRFAVSDVDCAKTNLTPADERKVIFSLGLSRDAQVLEKANADNRTGEKIDFGITVFVDMLNEHGRRRPHNTLPYIDAVTGFQSATTYYFNNDSGRLLKIIKTFRKAFRGMPTTLGYQGLVVDIAFRFCKSLLAQNGRDFCAEDKQ